MSKIMVGLLLIAGFITMGLIISITTIIGLNNDWASIETRLEAKYQDNQNSYDSMFKKIIEVAQVPKQYAEDTKSMYKAAIQGRYGEGGSKAMFQMLKEQNPTLDGSLYKQVQQVIEAGRNTFKADQTTLLDIRRTYQQSLVVFPNVLIARMLGFPKVNLSKYDVVSSEGTEAIFKTKKSEAVQVFGK